MLEPSIEIWWFLLLLFSGFWWLENSKIAWFSNFEFWNFTFWWRLIWILKKWNPSWATCMLFTSKLLAFHPSSCPFASMIEHSNAPSTHDVKRTWRRDPQVKAPTTFYYWVKALARLVTFALVREPCALHVFFVLCLVKRVWKLGVSPYCKMSLVVSLFKIFVCMSILCTSMWLIKPFYNHWEDGEFVKVY